MSGDTKTVFGRRRGEQCACERDDYTREQQRTVVDHHGETRERHQTERAAEKGGAVADAQRARAEPLGDEARDVRIDRRHGETDAGTEDQHRARDGKRRGREPGSEQANAIAGESITMRPSFETCCASRPFIAETTTDDSSAAANTSTIIAGIRP